MALITSYPQGAPSWADLATSDAAAAKKFYTELFGWTAEDNPAGPNMIYTMYKHGDSYVAASFQDDPEMSKGAPPRWQVYIAVDDVEAAAERVREAGGEVVGGPFDVMEAGRMAVVKDPQGAFVNLWQSKEHIGAGKQNEPGALDWFELATTDSEAASSFYEKVLGCSAKKNDDVPEGMDYTFLFVGDRPRAGIVQIQDDWGDVPPHWTVYIGVEDIAVSLKNLERLGGECLMSPQEIPVGTLALVKDPQGATFYIFRAKES